ncbi:MAG: pseudouridine synthase [Bacteroides sp.]|nr:pseudouridine synthase [Bacteroides sp.]
MEEEKKPKRPRIGVSASPAQENNDTYQNSDYNEQGGYQNRSYNQGYQNRDGYQPRPYNRYGNQQGGYQQRPYTPQSSADGETKAESTTEGTHTEGGFDQQHSYGYQPRQNGYQPRQNGYNNRQGGYNNNRQGGYNNNRQGGYNNGGYNNRQNGYNNNRQGGYNNGGYNNNRQGGYNNNRQGGYNNGGYNNNRQGGYNNNRQGGYNNGGYNNNRQGGYNNNRQGGYNNNMGGYQRNQGGFNNRNQGGYNRNQAGYNNNKRPQKFVPRPRQIDYVLDDIDLDAPIRLNKYMANAGICSRREADEYITSGKVKVNGAVVTELGTKIQRTDVVEFDDKIVTPERKCYVLLNKPKDCVTTSDDPNGRLTVMDVVKNACEERIYPVGRLDRNTTGVLLLTNDGELASKLTHPKFVKKKIYHVWTDKPIAEEDMQRIADGIELEDGEIHADAISYVSDTDRNQAGIEIHSGRNRIVRRIFEHLGYRVTKLDRVYFAGLTKKNLPRGRWRYLTQEEVNFLRMGAFE